ncbi:MBL fold metallo-hydrolase [Ponticaulis sp.]|uniref:MBL fold metallo-hydrolase n=1 Tax=Ponticaulis sp. TaxID=2020902 RepID=UPI002602AD77|nr:MBL fold metallo-hydrolase [Ponticaulis sp.]MDF1681581.1 MBL fold metallo-hydrolase [Ponticaulis sp.]
MDAKTSPDEQIGKSPKVKLDYPYEESEAPEQGTVKEVADGVFWVRMSLPFSLQWINLWLLRDHDGWVVVDTGMGMEETREHWRTIFDTDLQGLPVKRVIVTHMHPDHVGLAGWISRKFDAPLHMSQLEYLMCRTLVGDTGRRAPEAGIRFFKASGWDDEAIQTYKDRFGRFGLAVSRLPDSYERLSDGDVLSIDRSDWQVLVGSGHSPEHACLFNAEKNLFISGDQLLPRISSNVSVHPTEPNADPLTDWIESCARLRDALPEDVLVLPAHNLPFRGAKARFQALIDGHEKSLRRLLRRLDEPKTVPECFGAIFVREISPDILSLATGETLAHLNCLIGRGQAVRTLGDDGVWRYERVS